MLLGMRTYKMKKPIAIGTNIVAMLALFSVAGIILASGGINSKKPETANAAAASVTTNPASNLTKISATLNGNIIASDSEVKGRGFEWGTTTSYGNTINDTPSIITRTLGGTDNYPISIAVDSSGNVYTANQLSNNVTKITPGGVSSILGTTGDYPNDIVLDNAGNVYTTNGKSNNVTKITPGGVSTILGTTSSNPNGIAIDSSGNVYTANTESNNVTKITPGGVSSTYGTTGNYPVDIALDNAGNIYTANNISKNITKITTDRVSSIFGTTPQPPWGIAVGSNGKIYTSYVSGTIIDNGVKVFTPDGGSSETFLIPGSGPFSIALDSSNNVYTANYGTNDVSKISNIGIVSNYGSTGSNPTGIAVDSSGNVYTSNAVSNSVSKLYLGFNTGSFSSNLGSLTCGTTYHYRAFGVNGSGKSYGGDQTFTTSACTNLSVTTSAASDVTDTSADLNANIVSANGGITERGFQIGTSSGNYDLPSVSQAGSFTVGAYSLNKNGLSCGTTYYFRAYIANGSGTAYGNELNFTTTACLEVTTDPADPVYANYALLNGSIIITTSTVTTVGFQYGTSTYYEYDISQNVNYGIGRFGQELYNLPCGTTYHFRAYATNASGTDYGEDRTFTTTACLEIETNPATNVTGNSADLNGNILSTISTVTTWGFKWGTTTSYGNDISNSGTFGLGSFTKTVSMLQCNTTYHFKAYAVNSSGTFYGEDKEFTTTPCAEMNIQTAAATNFDATSANLNGNIISSATGITGRGFEWGTNLDYGNRLSDPSGSFTIGIYSLPLSGLNCGTTYFYRAYGTNATGEYYGLAQQFTTRSCMEISTDDATDLSESGANLNGNIISSASGITNRGFEWGTTTAYGNTLGDPLYYPPIGTYSLPLNGLNCNTTYHYRAYGVNASNIFRGNDKTFTTTACPTATVITTSASGFSATSATLNANITSLVGTITQRGFDIGSSTDNYNLSPISESGSYGTGVFSLNKTGLNCNTTYYFRAYVVNGDNNKYYFGNELNFTTSACMSVATDEAISVTGNSADLGGNIISTVEGATTIGFQWGITARYENNISQSGFYGVGTHYIPVSMLQCNTTYHFRFYAINPSGTYYGEDKEFTTRPCSEMNIQTAAATSIDATSANLNGNIISSATGIAARGFKWGTTTEYGNTLSDPSGTFTIGIYSLPLIGLNCGTTYHYQAYGINVFGEYYGLDQQFTTSSCMEISTDNATNVGGSGGDLNGNITSSATGITGRGFEWGTTTAYGNTLVDTSPGSGYAYTFQSKFGSTGTGDSQFRTPAGITTDKDDNIYIADSQNNRIQKFDSAGNYLMQIPVSAPPADMVVDQAGNIYATAFSVPSGANGYVLKYNASGTLIDSWGAAGSGDGQTSGPIGITIDKDGYLYVADTGNKRIQKFSTSGNHLMQFGLAGSGDGQFEYPSGIAVDSNGNIFVSDRINNRIQKFNSGGGFLLGWGSLGKGDSQFNNPYFISIDTSNNIFIADSFNRRVQKFDSSGNYLTQFGSKGSDDGQFQFALGIAISSSGKPYVGDGQLNRIQVFNPVSSYSTGSYSLPLSSLTCSTTYHYRAYGTNTNDTYYGEDRSFTTTANCGGGGTGGGGGAGGGGGTGGGGTQPPTGTTVPQATTPDVGLIPGITTTAPSTSAPGESGSPIIQMLRALPRGLSVSIPYLLLLLLLILAILYAIQSYREYRSIQKFNMLLNRYHNLQFGSRNFVALTNHYLGTPLGILQFSAELLLGAKLLTEAKAKLALSTIGDIKDKVHELLTESGKATAQSAENINPRLLDSTVNRSSLSPSVWVPMVIAGSLLIITDLLFIYADVYRLNLASLAVQVGLFVICALLIILAFRSLARNRYIRKQQSELLKSEQRLMDEKMNFVSKTSNYLKDDIKKIQEIAKDLPKNSQTKPFLRGLAMLVSVAKSFELMQKFSTISPFESITANETQAVVDEVLLRHKDQIKDKNLTIHKDITNDMNMGLDKSALIVLLGSTINNAIKFGKQNGNITIMAKNSVDGTKITVNDDGIGIDKSKIDELMEPFNRATDAMKYDYEGIGLGLYLDRIIMEQIGGSINIQSSPGVGTTVELRIPRGRVLENPEPLKGLDKSSSAKFQPKTT